MNAFSTPLKVAWVVWLAWGVGQYFWFRYERAGAPAPKVAAVAAPKPVVKKRANLVKPESQPDEAPVMGRLITPSHVEASPKPQPPVAKKIEQPVVATPPAPGFDPARAVIEQFGLAADSALDKFVADFERQDAHTRRNGSHAAAMHSYGAQAPPTP
jgi:hypothetical protein